jgi:hypothetical protein
VGAWPHKEEEEIGGGRLGAQSREEEQVEMFLPPTVRREYSSHSVRRWSFSVPRAELDVAHNFFMFLHCLLSLIGAVFSQQTIN